MTDKIDLTASKVLNKINSERVLSKAIQVFVKRDDLVHIKFGGNKFRKLKYNLLHAKKNNLTTLITFGGAYSNHIAATAFAGNLYNLKTIGVIRGDELNDSAKWSKTLIEANKNGMEFIFLGRDEFKHKYESGWMEKLKTEYPESLIIPEGGANDLSFEGVAEIVMEIEEDFNYIICPVGTGATFFGLIKYLKPHQKVIGIDVLKRNGLTSEKLYNELVASSLFKISPEVSIPDFSKCVLISDYHFGGYAKSNALLNKFCVDFNNQNNISIEPIYSGKMFFGLFDLADKNYFVQDSKIVALHTGGLQYL